MEFHFGQARKTVEQGGGTAGKTGHGFAITAIDLTHIHDQEGNLHVLESYHVGGRDFNPEWPFDVEREYPTWPDGP